MNFTQDRIAEFHLMSNTNKTLTYVHSVIPDDKLRILSITLSAIAFLGVISNVVILFLTRKESRYNGPLEHKRKTALLYYFVYNLALSDLLSSLISAPSVVILQYMHQFHTDAGCAAFRYIAYTFPALSNQILAAMCIERYCSLVFPFDNTRKKWPRRLVKVVWVSAFFWAGIMSFSFRANRVSLDESRCTMDCVQDLESNAKKAFFLSGLVFTFALPLFIICFTTIRLVFVILKCELKSNRVSVVAAIKTQATWLAVWLVIIYAMTFLPFTIYQIIKNFSHPNAVHLELDSTIRYSFSILCFSNLIINPVMYFKNIRKLRQKMRRILGLSTPAETAIVMTSNNNATFRNESSQAMPNVINRQTNLLRKLKVSPEAISSQGSSCPQLSLATLNLTLSHQSPSNGSVLYTVGRVGSMPSIRFDI